MKNQEKTSRISRTPEEKKKPRTSGDNGQRGKETGQQRLKILDGLAACLGKNTTELLTL